MKFMLSDWLFVTSGIPLWIFAWVLILTMYESILLAERILNYLSKFPSEVIQNLLKSLT